MSDQVVALEPARTRSTGVRHDPEIVDWAFRCWIDADGSAGGARRIMAQESAAEDAPDWMPLPDELPDVATVKRWVRRFGWHDQVGLEVERNFPAIAARQAARLVKLSDRALDIYDELSDPNTQLERDSETRRKVAADILMLRGLGTASAKGGEVVIARTAASDDDHATETPAQRQRRLLELAKTRTNR